MARIRSVHPDICVSETIEALGDPDLEVTFVRLWTHCDDHGRCPDNLLLIKAAIYPLKERVNARVLDGWLDQLAVAGLIVRYEVDGKKYLAVSSWDEFQHPNRPKDSKCPAPPLHVPTPPDGSRSDPSRNGHGPSSDESVTRHGHDTAGEGEGEGEGEKPPVAQPADARALVLVPEPSSPPATGRSDVHVVFDAWREATGKRRAKLDRKRKARIEWALKNYSLVEAVAAVRGWRHSPHHRGQNSHGTVYNAIELLFRDSEHFEKFRDYELRQAPRRPADAVVHEADPRF